MRALITAAPAVLLTLTTPAYAGTNDACDDAMPLPVPSSTMGSTVGATPDSTPFCGGISVSGGVWYSVVGTGNTLRASTCNAGSDFDTVLGVYCPTCAAPVCLAGSDDDCSDGFSGLLSTVSWCSEKGQEYLILVRGFQASVGFFQLDISDDGAGCDGGLSCPPNDHCANATYIQDGTVAFTTMDASPDGPALPPSCDEGNGVEPGPDAWFRYFPSCDGMLTSSTCGQAGFDTRLAVYVSSGDCGNLALVGCDDDSPGCSGGTSQVQVPVDCGTTVYIRVGGSGQAQGSGLLTVTCSAGDACPASCPGDVDGNLLVNVADMIAVILAWDTADPDADLNDDGIVNVVDLTQVVINWGPC